ncbi:MAG: RNA polymerase sigma-70 factor [Bacteroidaceae bacterium]|nr:RNA polymerase sigma-70 factor [Bacteroidaceae bacterium]
MDTERLLTNIQKNDSEQDFATLFHQNYERLFRVAFFYLQDDEMAKDVTLDVFADIWNKRKTMIVPRNFRNFSFTMVKNAAINMLEKEQRFSHDELPESDNGALNPGERLEQSELFEIYERALGELPERCREVFMRVKEDGMSYDETAQLLNISAKTVDAQMQKALKHIRSAIEAYMKHGDEQAKRFISIFL